MKYFRTDPKGVQHVDNPNQVPNFTDPSNPKIVRSPCSQATYQIPHATYEDQGEYSFACGGKSSTGRIKFCLNVTGPPTAKLSYQQSVSKKASYFYVGDSYDFTCEVEGLPPPEYVEWQFVKGSTSSSTRVKNLKKVVNMIEQEVFYLECSRT